MFAQNRDEVGMCIALVRKERLAKFLRQCELAVKGLLLRRMRGVVAEVIPPAFPTATTCGARASSLSSPRRSALEFVRVMRVHAGRGEQALRVRTCQCDRLHRSRQA